MIGVASRERKTHTHTHTHKSPRAPLQKKKLLSKSSPQGTSIPLSLSSLDHHYPIQPPPENPPVTTLEGHDKFLIELGSAKRLTPTPMQNRKEKPRLPCGDTSIASSWLAISPSFKGAPLSHLHPHRHCHHYCYHHWNPPPPLPLLLQEQSSSAHSCQTNQTRTDTAVYDKHD